MTKEHLDPFLRTAGLLDAGLQDTPDRFPRELLDGLRETVGDRTGRPGAYGTEVWMEGARRLEGQRHFLYAILAVITERCVSQLDERVERKEYDRFRSLLAEVPSVTGCFVRLALFASVILRRRIPAALRQLAGDAGYRRLMDSTEELLTSFRTQSASTRFTDVAAILTTGATTATAVSASLLEAIPRVYLRHGFVATSEDLFATAVDSPFLRRLAGRHSEEHGYALRRLAGCNDGCRLQDERGAVPSGSTSPAHLVIEFPRRFPSLEAFRNWHHSYAPWDADLFVLNSRGSHRFVDAPLVWHEIARSARGMSTTELAAWSTLGCPALFRNVIRRVSTFMGKLATAPELWEFQIRTLTGSSADIEAVRKNGATGRGACSPGRLAP